MKAPAPVDTCTQLALWGIPVHRPRTWSASEMLGSASLTLPQLLNPLPPGCATVEEECWYQLGLLQRLNELLYVKCLAQYLEHGP